MTYLIKLKKIFSLSLTKETSKIVTKSSSVTQVTDDETVPVLSPRSKEILPNLSDAR